MKLDQLMIELAQMGVSSTVSKGTNGIEVGVGGFSKSGTAILKQMEGYVLCETRYERKTEIRSVDDLVEEAWHWFYSYKDREPFTQPDGQWLPIFLRNGWIKETISYKVTRL